MNDSTLIEAVTKVIKLAKFKISFDNIVNLLKSSEENEMLIKKLMIENIIHDNEVSYYEKIIIFCDVLVKFKQSAFITNKLLVLFFFHVINLIFSPKFSYSDFLETINKLSPKLYGDKKIKKRNNHSKSVSNFILVLSEYVTMDIVNCKDYDTMTNQLIKNSECEANRVNNLSQFVNNNASLLSELMSNNPILGARILENNTIKIPRSDIVLIFNKINDHVVKKNDTYASYSTICKNLIILSNDKMYFNELLCVLINVIKTNTNNNNSKNKNFGINQCNFILDLYPSIIPLLYRTLISNFFMLFDSNVNIDEYSIVALLWTLHDKNKNNDCDAIVSLCLSSMSNKFNIGVTVKWDPPRCRQNKIIKNLSVFFCESFKLASTIYFKNYKFPHCDRIRYDVIKILHDGKSLPYEQICSNILTKQKTSDLKNEPLTVQKSNNAYNSDSDFDSDNEESSSNKCFLCLKPTRNVLKKCGHSLCAFCCTTLILKTSCDDMFVNCSLCRPKRVNYSDSDNE